MANRGLLGIVSIILRIAELAFATIVAGLNGDYLRAARHTSSWQQGRFIYTEVIAGISIVLSIIFLIPLSRFIHWPLDLFISLAWFVAFGLLANYLDDGPCGWLFNSSIVSFYRGDQCSKWKAVIAFAFLSAICWLISAIVGIIWVRDHETRSYRRRNWRGSRV
ncbi:Uu.00g097790.m01.CDS01 [Anthostomella pinea]|uniref:Uu.00g097790.m01.CDS01 n=1 Tax=Anthostomella pinea TaxID=933095 RepID=A0AAI8VCF5_9PEZI|nr:Uu.00g097790.m01.CDS01 [Anthostomella pinea]